MISKLKKRIRFFFQSLFNDYEIKENDKFISQQNYLNNLYQQSESYQQILRLLDFNLPIPQLRGSVISPDAALIIINHIILTNPKTLVEFGSGVSTLLWAQTIKKYGLNTKIYSFDHLEKYKNITEKNLANNNLNDVVNLIFSPLKSIKLNGTEYIWYDKEVIESTIVDISEIDMIFIDGPPRNVPTKYVRYPAIPVLYNKLNSETVIFLDDSNRADELEVIKLWIQNGFQVFNYDTEKGLAKIFKI